MTTGAVLMPKSSKPKRNDVSAKIDVQALRLAHTAASAAGMTLAEWLSDRVYAIAKQEVDAITSDAVLGGRKPKKA